MALGLFSHRCQDIRLGERLQESSQYAYHRQNLSVCFRKREMQVHSVPPSTWAIHPARIDSTNAAYTPILEEITRA